jgi:hypothetical protein
MVPPPTHNVSKGSAETTQTELSTPWYMMFIFVQATAVCANDWPPKVHKTTPQIQLVPVKKLIRMGFLLIF